MSSMTGRPRAMRLENAFVPDGGYWSSPFCKWQGSLAGEHPLRLAADVAHRALAKRDIPVERLDGLHLGTTIPSKHAFYGSPWVAGLLGAPEITGPTVSQACATSVRLLWGAASEVELGAADVLLALAADRTSDGPHLVYPRPVAPGGTPDAENWVLDNFQFDPGPRTSMLETAENVAAANDFTTEDQHQVALLRHEQYGAALADDAAFLRRFMETPLELNGGGKKRKVIDLDEGVFPTSAEGLARLGPVLEGGTVTFGDQTHPADGTAGMIVAARDRARELAADGEIEIRIVSFAETRTRQAFMPAAAAPAAMAALAVADIAPDDVSAFKIHDPFAVNDLIFCQELGLEIDAVNNFGCSLVWGHPQAPTGLRSIIELIEELRLQGGGYGLFSGCSAGDSAAAALIHVGEPGSKFVGA